MRRKDREVTDKNEIIDILNKCNTVRIALNDDYGYPYIVPMNFGYDYKSDELILYFHCANAGKRMELIKRSNKAAFEMDCDHKLITSDVACDFSMEYSSICGTGIIEVINGVEKISGINRLMKKYVGNKVFTFREEMLNSVVVLKLTVEQFSAKRLKKTGIDDGISQF